MSEDGRRANQSDPTAERTAEQSTQTAGGLGGGRQRPGADADDMLNRSTEERYDTPRRYEEEGDTDAAMPSNDSALNTKI